MFSENNRISGRQAFRLLTYDLLGLGTLLVPTVLSGVSGRDGIFGIFIGVLAGLLFLNLISKIVSNMKGSFTEYLEQDLGKFGGRIAEVCYLIYLILLAGYTAYLFANIVLQKLLREESFLLVLILILALVFYGMVSGIEGRARVYELLFWFLMIPLFFMLFSALDEIETDYWTPVFMTGQTSILAGGYYVFICLSLVFLVLFLGSYMKEKKPLMRAGKLALLWTGGIYAVLYLILLGVFGAEALSHMEFPAVTLMSTVKISGGFLKRADAFMFGIWFFTLYALLNSAVFYAGTVLESLSGSHGNAKRAERICIICILILTLVLAGIFYRSEEACDYYELFLWYIGTPFVVIVPFILYIKSVVLQHQKKE